MYAIEKLCGRRIIAICAYYRMLLRCMTHMKRIFSAYLFYIYMFKIPHIMSPLKIKSDIFHTKRV